MADVVKMEPASMEQDKNVDNKRRDSLEDSLEDDTALGQQQADTPTSESEEENSQSLTRSPKKSPQHTLTVIKASEAESFKNIVTDIDAVDGDDNPAAVNGETTETGDAQQDGVADDKVMASSDGYEPEPMNASTDSSGGKKVFAKVDIMEGSITVTTKSESETKEQTKEQTKMESVEVKDENKETNKSESVEDIEKSKGEMKTDSKETMDVSSSDNKDKNNKASKTDIKEANMNDTEGANKVETDEKGKTSPTTEEISAEYVKARVEAIEAGLQGAEGMDEGLDEEGADEEMKEIVWDDTPLSKERIDEIVAEYSSLPPEQLKKCLDFFWAVDKRGCGYFTVHDFAKVLKKRRAGLKDKEIVHMFVDLDLDRNLYVTLDEYLVEMSRKQVSKIRLEDVQPVFDELDANKDGLICEDDLDQWAARAVEYTSIHDVISDAIRARLAAGHQNIDVNAFLKIVKRYWDKD